MTTWLNVKNNAQSALYAGITAAATSLTLLAGEGAKFPASNFNISIDDEILLCTTRTVDVLTVTRVQEGTTAAIHAVGATVTLNVTAGIISQLQAAIDAAGGGGISNIDGFLDDTPVDGQLHKAPTSNALFDHAAAVSGAHGMNKSCRVTHSVSQSIATATVTVVAFDTERWDTDIIHDNSTNSTRLTCKTAGIYLIISNIAFAANATGRRSVYLKLNGTTWIGIIGLPAVPDGSTSTLIQVSTLYQLAVNDYVEVYCYQNSGASLNVDVTPQYNPEFMMARIA
ncbi:MAG: hypothetical protein ABSA18_12180 [Dehalococcoidia bacterium]|jgi:hypothetical protein